MSKVTPLVFDESLGPLALLQQVTARVQERQAEGVKIGVCIVVVTQEGEEGCTYGSCFSPLAAEQVLWASNNLRRRAEAMTEEPP